MVSLVKNFKITKSVNFFGRVLKGGEEPSSIITKAKWPKVEKFNTEGGDSGSLMTSPIITEWNNDSGTVKFQTLTLIDMIKKNKDNLFKINPCFLKPLDGDIIYSTDKKFLIIFKVLVQGKDDFVGCVFEGEKNKILINKGIVHTPPIIYQDNGNVNVIHRQTNGFSYVQLNSMLEMNIGGENIDNNLIKSIEESYKQADKETIKVKECSGSCKCEGLNKNLVIGDENSSFFDGINVVKIDECFSETPSSVKWKDSYFENKSQKLSQMFKMSWVEGGKPEVMEVKFNGLSGSFEGGEGKPGVIYDGKENKYSYKLLMTRPDGTFFVRSLTPQNGFIMSVAPPSEHNKPDFSRLINVYIPYGYGIRLNPSVWHSVPYPKKCVSSITLEEVICETNANVVIDLEEMCQSWFSVDS